MTSRQIQQFEEEGYLVVERLFTDAELQPVIDEISADLDQRCREAVAAGKLSRTYEEYDFEHRLTHVDAENQNISKSMWDMKVVLPSFFRPDDQSQAARRGRAVLRPGIDCLQRLSPAAEGAAAMPGVPCRGIRTPATSSLTATWG